MCYCREANRKLDTALQEAAGEKAKAISELEVMKTAEMEAAVASARHQERDKAKQKLKYMYILHRVIFVCPKICVLFK